MIHHEKYDPHCIYRYIYIYIYIYIYTYIYALAGRIFRSAFTKIKFLTTAYNPVLSKNHFPRTICLSFGSYIHLHYLATYLKKWYEISLVYFNMFQRIIQAHRTDKPKLTIM